MLIYIKENDKRFNFGYLAYIMAKKRLNIQSSQFIRNKLNHSLFTIKVQSQKGTCIDNDRLHSIRLALLQGINEEEPSIERLNLDKDKKPQVFKLPTVINYLEDQQKESTNLEISTLDQPGLLAKIGITFGNYGIFVRSARITTTGERADDFFSITDKQGRPLSERNKDRLAKALYQVLMPQSEDKAAGA